MMLYLHLGHEDAFSGSDESIMFIDRWMHLMPLMRRLGIFNG